MNPVVSKVREAKLEFYRKKGKIHAKAVQGRFNSLRWAMVWLTQIVFYGVCWLPWATEAGTRQAILFDIADEKLYLFDLVLWPQDALLLDNSDLSIEDSVTQVLAWWQQRRPVGPPV